MHFNTVDGNFQASQKNKNFDESDFSLTNGAAYFVEQTDFNEFKSKVQPPKKEVSMVLTFTLGVAMLTTLAGHDLSTIRRHGVLSLRWTSVRYGRTIVCAAYVHAPVRLG